MLAMLLATNADDAAASMIGGGSLIFTCACYGLIFVVAIACLVFWVMMLIDCIKRDEADFPNSSGNTKTIWLVVLLASWLLSANTIAAIVYYFMVKRSSAKTPSAPAAPPAPPV